jgi:selenophosphate synthase
MNDEEKRWIEAEAEAMVQDVRGPTIIGKLKDMARKKLDDDVSDAASGTRPETQSQETK